MNVSIGGDRFSRWYPLIPNSVPRNSIIDKADCMGIKRPTTCCRDRLSIRLGSISYNNRYNMSLASYLTIRV